ncbi:MAG TPA: hypothetical protein VH120_15640 [Gemmataceae bacterium]|jgi:hypothetical protein|nr:hypothetical protein [Gemmataceae bacterium]
MLHDAVSAALRLVGGRPCFRIYGRASYEPQWHVIDVIASHRRDLTSRWPHMGGTCITWTAGVIAVGWDFAEFVLREQSRERASQEYPLAVRGGRLRAGRLGKLGPPTASEVLAHECGHTGQARRMGFWYWPMGATFTLFREGDHWWNWFENEASATGQFGGIVA